MEEQGVLDVAGLARTLEAIEQVVVENGGAFVDLHDSFATEAFRDAPGHLVYEGHALYDGFDGPTRLAEKLAPHVLASALERSTPATSRAGAND
jgi:hypothetical protein